MAKVRLGFADVALARPLTWALLKGEHSELFKTSVLPHSRIAPLLVEGALDVGLVTEAERERCSLEALPDLAVVLVAGGGVAWMSDSVSPAGGSQPDCPGCHQVARSVLAQREASATDEFDLRVGLETLAPEGTDGLQGESLRPVGREDLGKLYFDAFAQEPVVYEWARRADFDSSAAEFALKSSLRFGLRGLDALSRELAAERSLDPRTVEGLLRTGVRYVRPARP